MKQQSKKIVKLLAAVLALFLIIQMPAAYATSLSDLKDEQKQIQQKKSELKSSINEKSSSINEIEDKLQSLMNQINDLVEKIDKTNAQIKEVNADIEKANAEIAELEKNIAELEKKIEERNELLEDRARAIQVSGNVSYIDVLLGASSFVDFIDRFSAVTTLLDADRKIMREQKADKAKLEDDKAVLENTKKALEKNQAQLTSLKSSLDSQKAEKNTLLSQLESEQGKLEGEKKLLEEQYSEAVSVSKDIQSKIASEQKRIAEIARQEALKKAQQSPSNGGTVDVSSGTWTKPTNGRLTSPFGWRNLGSGNEFHYGVDLANSIGTTIVAANDGVVSYAGSLSTYGNVIMITHYVDGKQWTTVYAHLSSIQVSVGQSVNKGGKIGLMGNTGRSYGSHLHFEIHNGPWVSGRPHAQNPLNYISL